MKSNKSFKKYVKTVLNSFSFINQKFYIEDFEEILKELYKKNASIKVGIRAVEKVQAEYIGVIIQDLKFKKIAVNHIYFDIYFDHYMELLTSSRRSFSVEAYKNGGKSKNNYILSSKIEEVKNNSFIQNVVFYFNFKRIFTVYKKIKKINNLKNELYIVEHRNKDENGKTITTEEPIFVDKTDLISEFIRNQNPEIKFFSKYYNSELEKISEKIKDPELSFMFKKFYEIKFKMGESFNWTTFSKEHNIKGVNAKKHQLFKLIKNYINNYGGEQFFA